MCMLTFLPPGVLPNTDRLRNGTVSNRDGHGWAIVVMGDDGKGSHIVQGHSMSATAAIEAFELTRKKHPEGPALFHSRFTTGGTVDETNCHPYVVNRDPRTVLAHNGILPSDLHQPVKDRRSDTRYFCDVWGRLLYPGSLPGKDFNLNSKRGRRRLRDWLTDANKFVVLTVDPTFRNTWYLLNANQGIWEDDDCWYSNRGYMEKTWGTGYGLSSYDWTGKGYESSYRPGKRWWEDAEPDFDAAKSESVWQRLARATDGTRPIVDKGDVGEATPEGPCYVCGAKNLMHPLNYCLACGTCDDCLGDAMDEFADRPCTCLWPTGTNPARQRSLSEAFREHDVPADPPIGQVRAITMGPSVDGYGSSDPRNGWDCDE